MIREQRTIKTPAYCEGVGLHSGQPVQMRIKPAPADTGVLFVRTDLGGKEIKAVAANTAATSYATTLSRDGVRVGTVEHLLAAFSGLNIDNVIVELDAGEVPIMDGSAGPFMRLLADAGIRIQDRLQPMLKIIRPVFVRDGSRQIAVWPAETTGISCLIDFDHPLLGKQELRYAPSEESFVRDVADARTFGFLGDVEALRANGLARGASLENCVALTGDAVLNTGGLRYRDEFVRHKVLDLIGDLSLAGMPVIGHVLAQKSGHALNARMVSKLLSSPEHWIVVGVQGKAKVLPEELQYQSVSA